MSTAKWLQKAGRPIRQGSFLRRVFSLATVEEQWPDKVDLDWDNLSFEYRKTDSFRVHTWTKDNGWDDGTSMEDGVIELSPMCPALHYGQQAFEGLKAFESPSGDINIFHPDNANATRMNASCARMCMPKIPIDMFNEAIIETVQDNRRWVPPHGKGALYIRPFIIGTGEQLGLAPASEYKFVVSVMPVGTYYEGRGNGLNALIMSDFDRAATRGTGAVKVGGNYGADLLPNSLCHERGYDTCLYVDSETQSFIEEFSVANFAAITPDGCYLTPESHSVLPSVTNSVLMQLARDSGLEVQRRPVAVAELPTISEVAAIGTAVVVNPIGSITCDHMRVDFDYPATLVALKHKLLDIQNGLVPDTHDWLLSVPE
mmetsp:Transcript_149305/g.212250  ORF Transcript_149305/g.212250 Transcript_149305/m.212250 type:complete len:372 (-) Transcript_149305:142-1257(-)